MTLRIQKKQQTRRALAEAATRLALERGFDAVTVDEIADAAVVSRRTFFRYFDSKEAAFFAEHEARLERFRAALLPTPGEPPLVMVRRVLLDLAAEYDAKRDEVTRRHRVIEASPALLSYELGLDRRYEATIVTALAGGPDPKCNGNGLAPGLRAAVRGAAMFGAVRAVLRHWFEDPLSPPLVELGAAALSMLDAGFSPAGPPLEP